MGIREDLLRQEDVNEEDVDDILIRAQKKFEHEEQGQGKKSLVVDVEDIPIRFIDEAMEVEGADKLLKLIVNLDKEKRTIFAGIKSAYKVEDLVGRSVVVAANLAPRKMKFGTSEGMILAAGPGGDQIFLLSTDEGAKPGMKIK